MSLQFFLAVIAYVVPLFPLAYLWHLSTFKTSYDRLEIFRDNPVIPLGLASMVLQGVFFAWVFPKLFGGPSWIANGLEFAVIFAVLGWSFMVLPVAAKYRMTSVGKFMILETAFVVLQFVVTGLLIAWVYRI